MEQMACEDDRQVSNPQRRRCDNRVIPGDMRVNDVEAAILQSRSKSQGAHPDIRIQRAVAMSREHDAVTALSKLSRQLENVRFTTANRFCGINLQNAHCGLRNRIRVRSG